MNKNYTLLFLLVLLSGPVWAQAPPVYSSSDIYLQLQKLDVLGSVLYIGAHPDDENTRLLAYLSKEKKYRTAYLSLTRGDGGQNLIGDERGVALGMIRTQELLAARRMDGAEQFFSTAYDFGYSKSSKETFHIWDKEKLLGDVVWVIRKFRPDVIITRFPEDQRAGHGQHSASAILAHEAFFAAADTTRFPEQFRFGVSTWQAKRLLWNTYHFGGINTTSNDQFKIEVGGYNPLIGKSYGEMAAESRSQHKSQGFGVSAQRGTAYEYFTTVAGSRPADDLMDGINTTWNRLGDPYPARVIDTLLHGFRPDDPAALLPALLRLRDHLNGVVDYSGWVKQKTKELDRLIAACLGLYFEATTHQPFAVTGDSLPVTFTVINRSHFELGKVRISCPDTSFTLAQSLSYDQPEQVTLTRKIKGGFEQDQPYWLRDQMTEGQYTVKAQSLIGLPQNPDNEIAVTYFFKDHFPVTLHYGFQYKYTDHVKGEVYEPLITVPAVLVSAFPAVVLNHVTPAVPHRLVVRYQSLDERGVADGHFIFSDAEGESTQRAYRFTLHKDQSYEIPFNLDSLPIDKKKNTDLSVAISLPDKATGGTETFSNYLRLISYEHIPTVHYLYQAKVKVINDPITVVGRKIGYIKGAGDDVPDALTAMGYDVVILGEEDLVPEKLRSLDAVITGVRAYNVHDFLGEKYDVLMNYIKNGGNLIVQYNTNNNISAVNEHRIGPYDFTITRNRVTDETAKVNFLLPKDPVLNYPNKITDKDFDGWIQERGIYFAEGLDPAYETPLSMADPDEAPQKGSLIIGHYGKGCFVYTGLDFFRELPAGVPGAYRLLANIIALNKKKGF